MSAGDDATPRDVLNRVKPELARKGHKPTGPHTAHPGGRQYLTLSDGRRVCACHEDGYWQLHVYTPIGSGPPPVISLLALTSIVDPDGRNFPGDPM